MGETRRRTRPQEDGKRPLQGSVWVTRQGVHVDRIASAWLIRRFIDPEARFKFVPAKGYVPEPGELRFDMFEAEFTHEGDRCTFEVLLARAGLADPALAAIGEIVHDIDLKDAKFGREETAASRTWSRASAVATEGTRSASSAAAPCSTTSMAPSGRPRADPASLGLALSPFAAVAALASGPGLALGMAPGPAFLTLWPGPMLCRAGCRRPGRRREAGMQHMALLAAMLAASPAGGTCAAAHRLGAWQRTAWSPRTRACPWP